MTTVQVCAICDHELPCRHYPDATRAAVYTIPRADLSPAIAAAALFDAITAEVDKEKAWAMSVSHWSDGLREMYLDGLRDAMIAARRAISIRVDPFPALGAAAMREAAVKSLRDWQNDLVKNRLPDTAIAIGIAADLLATLPLPGENQLTKEAAKILMNKWYQDTINGLVYDAAGFVQLIRSIAALEAKP